MRISKVRSVNFANFQNLEVETGANLVIVGENNVGKSNFIWARQLLLDPAFPELAITCALPKRFKHYRQWLNFQ